MDICNCKILGEHQLVLWGSYAVREGLSRCEGSEVHSRRYVFHPHSNIELVAA